MSKDTRTPEQVAESAINAIADLRYTIARSERAARIVAALRQSGHIATDAERAVVEAAMGWSLPQNTVSGRDLINACEALLAERKPKDRYEASYWLAPIGFVVLDRTQEKPLLTALTQQQAERIAAVLNDGGVA